jgi:hypothetical protein
VAQHGRQRRRDVAFQSPQAPLQHRPRCAGGIEPFAQPGDGSQAWIGRRAAEEAKIGLRRPDAVDARQFAAEGGHHRVAPGLVGEVPNHAVRRGHAFDTRHDEEGTPDHRDVAAEVERPRHRHPGGRRGAQQGELLRPGMTDRQRRRRIRPQHPGLLSRRAGDVERPVLLDGTARQAPQAGDEKPGSPVVRTSQ